MVRVAGWDIGGANTKACCLSGDDAVGRSTLTRSLAVWREPERLAPLLAAMAAELGPVAAHGVTMTAELCDVFASKAEGVAFVLDAVSQAFGAVPTWIWTVDGRFRPPADVRAEPLRAAAANWLATASLLARRVRRALLVDIGSTTADLILIADGQVAAAGRDDPGRLAAGELVYTGMVRTPVCAVARELFVAGRPVRTAAEWFAVTGDAALLLGLIGPEDYPGPTPDGRPATAEAAARRLARMVCADVGPAIGLDQVCWLARQVAEAQLTDLTRGALQVLSRAEAPGTVPVVGAGLGRALAAQLARRLELPFMSLEELGLDGGQTAPAAAVAGLLAEEVFSWPLALI